MKLAFERNGTQKEVALRSGYSISTVKRKLSMNRDVYMTKAEQRRWAVAKLIQEQNYSYAQVADELNISVEAVRGLYKRYNEKLTEKQQPLPL